MCWFKQATAVHQARLLLARCGTASATARFAGRIRASKLAIYKNVINTQFCTMLIKDGGEVLAGCSLVEAVGASCSNRTSPARIGLSDASTAHCSRELHDSRHGRVASMAGAVAGVPEGATRYLAPAAWAEGRSKQIHPS